MLWLFVTSIVFLIWAALYKNKILKVIYVLLILVVNISYSVFVDYLSSWAWRFKRSRIWNSEYKKFDLYKSVTK